MSEKPISPLRQHMIDDMTSRRFSEATQRDYVRSVRNFTAFLGRSPDTATRDDLRRFQLHMARQQVSPWSINGAIAVLRFFFTVTLERPDLVRPLWIVNEPRKAPVVLSQEEVARLLEAAPGLKYKAAVSVAYGAGPRVSWVANLHAWGSALTHHPHVHVIVSGGGLSPDGLRWIACTPGLFLPVRVLSRLFRRLFLENLEALHAAGRLAFLSDLAPLTEKRAFDAALASLRRSDWFVHAKRPSPDRRPSLPISPAIPAASQSQIRVSLRSTRRASPSNGGTIGSTAAIGSRP
jgi:hypothetical protein